MTNIADMGWLGEDEHYVLPPPGDDVDPLEVAYAQAQADLALAGAKRSRYGALPGRDPAICAQLNADIEAAWAACEDARNALANAREAQ